MGLEDGQVGLFVLKVGLMASSPGAGRVGSFSERFILTLDLRLSNEVEPLKLPDDGRRSSLCKPAFIVAAAAKEVACGEKDGDGECSLDLGEEELKVFILDRDSGVMEGDDGGREFKSGGILTGQGGGSKVVVLIGSLMTKE